MLKVISAAEVPHDEARIGSLAPAVIIMGMINPLAISKQIATCILALVLVTACSKGVTQKSNDAANTKVPAPTPQARATPSNAITPPDVAKLVWIAGTWQGTGDGRLPFYERYRFDGTTLIVESFDDEKLARIGETSRFELKNGEFGHTKGNQRSAASYINDDAVQFVSVGAGNDLRFERKNDHTWRAILETPATPDRPARRTEYKMEPWPK